MRKILLGLILLLGLMGIMAPTQAANIFVRYFESADVVMTDSSFQLFTYAALENEHITIVAYGLDEAMVPALILLDANGVTVAEDLNTDSGAVAVVEHPANENGVYTFVASRLTDVGGLMRVMVFEGDPMEADFSLLDTVDPLLPSRAYLIASPDDDSVDMAVYVIPDPDNPTAELPLIFATRGTDDASPSAEDRLKAADEFGWVNEGGQSFYTVNVRATPEPLIAKLKINDFMSVRLQALVVATIQLDLGEGTEDPQLIERPSCGGVLIRGADFLAGPSEDFIAVGRGQGGMSVEILGENGDYFLIVDVNNAVGASWVLKADVNPTSDLQGAECSRVELFAAPDLTDTNRRQQPPSGSGSGGGSGSGATPNPLAGLSPAGAPPSSGPGEGEEGVSNPPPCLENCGPEVVHDGIYIFSASYRSNASCNEWEIDYSEMPATGVALKWSRTGAVNSAIPPSGVVTYIFGSFGNYDHVSGGFLEALDASGNVVGIAYIAGGGYEHSPTC